MLCLQVLELILYFVPFIKFSAYQFQLQVSILCYIVFLYKYHKNSFEKIKTNVKIGIFPIPIACWSEFRIFKQNWENADEIGMVGQSVL